MTATRPARISTSACWQIALLSAVFIGGGCTDPNDTDPILADLPMLYTPQGDESAPWVVVPVTVGAQEYRFVIDTCCSSTTFDRRLRALLGPTVGTMQSNRNLSDTTVKIERCRVPKDFRIGRLKLSGIIECLDLAAVEGRETPYPHDGIIGMDVLDGKVLQLDLNHRRVRLLQPGRAGLPQVADWGHAVPFTRDRHRFAVIQTQAADDVEESFLFDTGMLGVNWLRAELFEQLRNRPGFRSVQGPDAEMIVVADMRIGDFPLADLVFVRGTRSILGTAFLTHFRTLTLNLHNNRLYLAPSGMDTNESVSAKFGRSFLRENCPRDRIASARMQF
jgi:hypothetical protein